MINDPPATGEVAEWPKAPDSKSGLGASPTWVRLPPSPQKQFLITTERCPSGRRGTIGNRVYRKVPRVRIPLSPQLASLGFLSGAAFRSRARVLPLRAPPHWGSLPGSGTSGRQPGRPALHWQVALARRQRAPAGPLPPRHPRRSLHAADNENLPFCLEGEEDGPTPLRSNLMGRGEARLPSDPICWGEEGADSSQLNLEGEANGRFDPVAPYGSIGTIPLGCRRGRGSGAGDAEGGDPLGFAAGGQVPLANRSLVEPVAARMSRPPAAELSGEAPAAAGPAPRPSPRPA